MLWYSGVDQRWPRRGGVIIDHIIMQQEYDFPRLPRPVVTTSYHLTYLQSTCLPHMQDKGVHRLHSVSQCFPHENLTLRAFPPGPFDTSQLPP